MTENNCIPDRLASRRKVLSKIVVGLSATATAGRVTATDPDERTTTAGGAEVDRNEILFAQRKLPHYLDETILGGDTRVIITRSGERPPQMNPEDNDVTLSTREYRRILDSATNEYVDKFGVNPSAPRVQMIDGKPYTKTETQKLLKPKSARDEAFGTEQSAVTHSPHPVDGTVRVHMLEAADKRHRPQEAWYGDSTDALERFETFGPTTRVSIYYGHWKPKGEADKSKQLLQNIARTQSDKQDNNSDLVAGWVDHATNNGIARINGYYSVNATSTNFIDWPHASIFQHELSHNFGARHGPIGCTSLPCIMNYASAKIDETEWCDSCRKEVSENMA